MRNPATAKSATDVKAALMLKGVRDWNGRQVAELALISRAVATVQEGVKATINYRGTLLIDMATGLTLKADISGRFQASVTTTGKDAKGKKTTATTTSGTGKVAVHVLAYILAEPGAAHAQARSVGESPNSADAVPDFDSASADEN